MRKIIPNILYTIFELAIIYIVQVLMVKSYNIATPNSEVVNFVGSILSGLTLSIYIIQGVASSVYSIRIKLAEYFIALIIVLCFSFIILEVTGLVFVSSVMVFIICAIIFIDITYNIVSKVGNFNIS